MFIGYDPGTCMTLTYFTARSTWVAYAFELGKLIKCQLKVKNCRKWANGLNMYDSENIWTPCPYKIKTLKKSSSLELLNLLQ